MCIKFKVIIFLLSLVVKFNQYNSQQNYEDKKSLNQTDSSNEVTVLQKEALNLFGLDRKPSLPRKPINFEAFKYIEKILKISSKLNDNLNDKFDNLTINSEILNYSTLNSIQNSDIIQTYNSHFYLEQNQFTLTRKFFIDINKALNDHHQLIRCELKIYKENNFLNNLPEKIKLKLYFINQFDISNETIEINENYEGWIMINVTKQFQKLIELNKRIFNLSLEVYLEKEKNVQPESIGLIFNEGKYPFLISYIKSSSEQEQLDRAKFNTLLTKFLIRHRRESLFKEDDNLFEDSVTNEGETDLEIYINQNKNVYRRACELNSVHLRFKDMGWDEWILSPEGFTFFFCEGSCAFPIKNSMNATNHAILQSLMHLQNPKIIPKASCAPTKLAPIRFVVLDENSNIEWKTFKKMIVDSCGCH